MTVNIPCFYFIPISLYNIQFSIIAQRFDLCFIIVIETYEFKLKKYFNYIVLYLNRFVTKI